MKNSFNPFKVFFAEIWQKHPIYENYQASNFGQIRTTNFKRSGQTQILKQSKDKKGYLQFNVYVNAKPKTIRSHRFIWECWNGLIPDGFEIDHIDTVRTNNNLTNLRLCTPKENSNNSLSKMHYSEAKKGKKGRKHSLETKLKISESKKKPIKQYSKSGEFIKEWPSATEVENELNLNHSNIGKCCKGKVKSAGGFIWKYV